MRRPTDIQGSLLMLVCIGECKKADTLHGWLGGIMGMDDWLWFWLAGFARTPQCMSCLVHRAS